MKKIIILGPAHPLRGGIASSSERLAQAELLFSTYQLPEVNKIEVLKRYLEAGGIEGIERLIIDPSQMPPPPEAMEAEADAAKEQAKNQLNIHKQMLKEKEFQLKANNAQVQQMIEAEKLKLNEKDIEVKELKARLDLMVKSSKIEADLIKEENGILYYE